MKITYELLEKFCDSDRRNGIVEKPHNYDGKTFATNGYIGILTDSSFTDDVCNYDINKVCFDGVGELKDIPVCHSDRLCDVCKGTGYVQVHECTNCDSSGEVEFHDDAGNTYECECKECYGDGGEKEPSNSEVGIGCTSCNSTGKHHRDFAEFGKQDSDVFVYGISSINIELLKLLPNVKIYSELNEKKNFTFVFDGGVGIVMPFRLEK